MLFIDGCSAITNRASIPSKEAPVSTASATIQSTLTSISIVTPTSLSTPTAVPTLSIEDARTKFLDLLASNGDCRLPCLWGITPGKSTYLEARTILMPLSGVAETAYFGYTSYPEDDISPLYVEGDLRLNARVLYVYGNDGIVSLLTFRALEEKVAKDSNGNSIETPIYDSAEFKQRVEYYSLSHLLTEQGLPTSVMIASSGPSINRSGSILTHIAVLYPEKGIWAQYTTSVNETEVADIIRSCPVDAHIEMELSPPGNPDSFFTLLDKTDWGVTKNSYKPLEEATSLSVKEFYQTFRNPTDKCIETPVDLWPTPEPGGG
jgi:hypothetical protein